MTIAELKVQEVVNWRRERIADGRILAASEPQTAVRQVLRGQADLNARGQVLRWAERIRQASGYAVVVLLNQNGEPSIAAGAIDLRGRSYPELAKRVIEGGEVNLSDIHLSPALKALQMCVTVPLRFGPNNSPEGVLLLGIDPNAFLFPLIQSWPTPSRTAETLLARRDGNDVLFLNELRHRKGTALTLRVPLTDTELPAARAVLGHEGLFEGADYRGVRVLSALHGIPGSPWALVAKEDIEEAYEPVRQQVLWLGLMACSLALAIAAGVALAWRNVRLNFHRQRHEAELRRQALLAHFDYLSRFANDIVLLTDNEARIIEANDRALSAYGYESGELIGRPVRDLRDPSTYDVYEKQWHAVSSEGGLVFETLHRRKDGSTFPVEVSARRIVVEGATFTQSIIRDITERKQAEEEKAKLQGQLLQSQKMESIGRLAGGVAHDFNNLLTVINGYASFALDELPADDPMADALSEISKAGERAAALTQQLLAFSRKQLIDPKVLDLNGVVTDLCKMLRRLVGDDVEIVTHLAPAAVKVRADHGQMQQVLMNLATNARDAMPGGGRLVIETDAVELGEDYLSAHAEAKAGSHVLLTVSDTGTGMDKETRERAFEPFYTTKPKGEGTGLGLSTVYGIVKQSGGWIWVYSEPGRGTAFKIYLPRVSDTAEADAAARPAATGELYGAETVLVVEDQAEVRRLAVEILSRHGYNVLEAANGQEALSLSAAYRDSIHLMLTDVVMPGMTGGELASRLAAVRSEMKVLYTSGYTANGISHNGVLDPGVAYLAKPFSPLALVQKVRELLNATDGQPPVNGDQRH